MRLSKYLFTSQKSLSAGSMEALYKACAINQQGSGIFEFGPLGTALMKNIEGVIRNELDLIGGLEVRLPLLQVAELWNRSERIDKYGKEMFKLKDRHEKTMVLAPTAEEAALNIVSKYVLSYKQLPFHIYQIAEKYRDEMRPRFGLIRARQFTMKDAYSFCETREQAEKLYLNYYNTYLRIFKKLGINVIPVEAETGEIGGDFSHEFVAPCEFGEEEVFYEQEEFKEIEKIEDLKNLNSSRKQGKNKTSSLELGQIFYLGTEYSDKMEVYFNNSKGEQKSYIMGCYGIGVSRVLAYLSLKDYWPDSVAPFRLYVMGIDQGKSEDFYKKYNKFADKILFDDRDVSVGTKFNDADVLKMPYRLVIGKNFELSYCGKLISYSEDIIKNLFCSIK